MCQNGYMVPTSAHVSGHQLLLKQSDAEPATGRVLLIACYESGLQPLNLAQPKAVLEQRGFAVDVLDLSVQTLAELPTAPPNAIAVSVPMQTALRLAVSAVSALRSRWPDVPITFYGLYAGLNAPYLLETGTADHVLAGESELALAEWCEQATRLQARPPTATESPLQEISLRQRLDLPRPNRTGLPDLEQYARFQAADGSLRTAGQVAASRGCLHTCRHCPVVPIYRGRFFVRDLESVTGDIRQQIEAGAGHISFVDPDFLNGPGHAVKVTEWLHQTYPEVTFDFTAKVEHLLGRARHLAALKANGAAFVVSAFEAVSDDILERLDKGHTVRDMERVLPLLAGLDLPVHPTWLPFTPLDLAPGLPGHAGLDRGTRPGERRAARAAGPAPPDPAAQSAPGGEPGSTMAGTTGTGGVPVALASPGSRDGHPPGPGGTIGGGQAGLVRRTALSTDQGTRRRHERAAAGAATASAAASHRGLVLLSGTHGRPVGSDSTRLNLECPQLEGYGEVCIQPVEHPSVERHRGEQL